MILNYNIQKAEYCVSGRNGFSLTDALRLWKTKFDTLENFSKEVIKHAALQELGDYVAEMWEEIQPVSVEEALQEPNMEIRRVKFDCIGVVRLFKELDPELLDKQTIKKSRTRWDAKNQPYQYEFEDTYELYKLDGNKILPSKISETNDNDLYAVRCWCTTTGREYWIYVNKYACFIYKGPENRTLIPDAINAIAWTIRIDVSNPKRIYRQGDIIVVEESPESKTISPYHLNRELYLELMYSET